MAISNDTAGRLMIALTSQSAGQEVVNALNDAAGASWVVVKMVQDAAASTTLAGLLVGDLVIDLTTVANNAGPSGNLVVTANTIPYTPTQHDVLMVLRATPAPTAQTIP